MNDKKQIKLLSVSTGNCTHIKVELYYTKGGMNYFTSSVENRGLYISVQPITKTENSVIYTAFTGIKQCVKKMGRFDKRVFDNFSLNEWDLYCMICHVIEKNNIKLTSESEKELKIISRKFL